MCIDAFDVCKVSDELYASGVGMKDIVDIGGGRGLAERGLGRFEGLIGSWASVV
jgi:hypothetical protein